MSQDELIELARRCQQENMKYRSTGNSDPSYCLKLFRLSLEEMREDAWAQIVECYTSDLEVRFHRHPWFQLLREYQDDIINTAFARLFEQNSKEPLQVKTLAGILNYLHRCLATAILISKRDKDKGRFTGGTPDDWASIPGLDDIGMLLGVLEAEEIWETVKACTRSKVEQQVMYLWLVQDYTATEIVQYLPAGTLVPTKVYQIGERVMRCVRRRYAHTRL